MPVRFHPDHPKCVSFSRQNFPPELLTGVQTTRLHVQTGDTRPPDEILKKDKNSPVFRTSVMGATLTMFKLGILLICHFHLPVGAKGELVNENIRERMFYTLFHEFRLLRVPTDFLITIDRLVTTTKNPFPHKVYMEGLRKSTGKLAPFLHPNDRCQFPTRSFEQEKVSLYHHKCPCLLCRNMASIQETDLSPPGMVDLFKGDINILTGLLRPVSTNGSTPSSQKKSRIELAVSSFTEIDEDDDDIPLDPLGYTDEYELDKFMNTHPGFEYQDEMDNTILPPESVKPETTERIIEKNPPVGVPDTYRQAEWRDFFDINKVEVSEDIRNKLAALMDKYKRLFSCYATDCRPIYCDGKVVEVDIDLTTDKPIFIKSFPMSHRMSEVLDKKLDELIDRREIVEIQSPYNIPVLLAAHNSSSKHVPFEQRQFRLCLDLRVLNAHTEHKNYYSQLVKGIDPLYTRLQGMTCISKGDGRKAYRSMPASEHLRRICAFRVPYSIKYPYKIFSFRSTADGLSILPGLYSFYIQKALSPHSRSVVIQHLDDILIFSPDEETHLKDLESVFDDLLKANVMLAISKFEAFKKEILFLGHIVDGLQIWIPSDRKSYFDSLKQPSTKKELQSLLGVSNYMSHFIDGYHLRVGPLFEIMKGKTDKQHFTLTEPQMKAFQDLKMAIRDAEKLHIVDFNKPIFMEADSSLWGTGSILYQEVENPDNPCKPKRVIIRYGSRRFSITEALHHTSLEREGMGVLLACHTHAYYLQGCTEAVICTDLKSLITLLSCYNNPDSARMARLSHRLYSLPFKWRLIHVAGVDLPLADALSRLHPPYQTAFSDRKYRYPDLKRENILAPAEWRKDPNTILTTMDIMKSMHDQVVFIEKSSLGVKSKRLKAMAVEVSILYDALGDEAETFKDQIDNEIEEIENEIKILSKHSKDSKEKQKQNQVPMAGAAPLTAVSPRIMITPHYIVKHQNENPKMNSIIMHLRTTEKDKIQKALVRRYRLLNDSILVTRKNKKLPFDAPGNIRIMCDTKMTLNILSLLHIMGGHYGINTLIRLFAQTYKCHENLASYCKMVALGCRACRLHRTVQRKQIPLSRIPLSPHVFAVWCADHMCFKREQHWKGRKIDAALNFLDTYSNLLISHLVPDQKHTTTIKCLKETFSVMPAPLKMVSDNSTSLCANKDVVAFLRSRGVQTITTITAYNSKANKVERIHKTLRETIKLVQETFQRKSQFDMYHTVITMMNNRPLSLTLHPHIRAALKDKTEIVTPFSLHFGIKPPAHPQIPMEDVLAPDHRERYREKWQAILADHDKMLQEELEEKQKPLKEENKIHVGDLVLLRNLTSHKEDINYYRNIYEVINIQGARYFCSPLFKGKKIMESNANNLKPYSHTHLFEYLPSEVRHLMGETLTPDELKQRSKDDPNNTPTDFEDWALLKLPEAMRLRRRLTPASLISVPAISLTHTNTISHLTEDSDSDGTFSFRSGEGANRSQMRKMVFGVPKQPEIPQHKLALGYRLKDHSMRPQQGSEPVAPAKASSEAKKSKRSQDSGKKSSNQEISNLQTTGKDIQQKQRKLIKIIAPAQHNYFTRQKAALQNKILKPPIQLVTKESKSKQNQNKTKQQFPPRPPSIVVTVPIKEARRDEKKKKEKEINKSQTPNVQYKDMSIPTKDQTTLSSETNSETSFHTIQDPSFSLQQDQNELPMRTVSNGDVTELQMKTLPIANTGQKMAPPSQAKHSTTFPLTATRTRTIRAPLRYQDHIGDPGLTDDQMKEMNLGLRSLTKQNSPVTFFQDDNLGLPSPPIRLFSGDQKVPTPLSSKSSKSSETFAPVRPLTPDVLIIEHGNQTPLTKSILKTPTTTLKNTNSGTESISPVRRIIRLQSSKEDGHSDSKILGPRTSTPIASKQESEKSTMTSQHGFSTLQNQTTQLTLPQHSTTSASKQNQNTQNVTPIRHDQNSSLLNLSTMMDQSTRLKTQLQDLQNTTQKKKLDFSHNMSLSSSLYSESHQTPGLTRDSTSDFSHASEASDQSTLKETDQTTRQNYTGSVNDDTHISQTSWMSPGGKVSVLHDTGLQEQSHNQDQTKQKDVLVVQPERRSTRVTKPIDRLGIATKQPLNVTVIPNPRQNVTAPVAPAPVPAPLKNDRKQKLDLKQPLLQPDAGPELTATGRPKRTIVRPARYQ